MGKRRQKERRDYCNDDDELERVRDPDETQTIVVALVVVVVVIVATRFPDDDDESSENAGTISACWEVLHFDDERERKG